MKQQTLYVCELCHTSYADEEKAKECEAYHRRLYPKTQIIPLYKRMTKFGVPAELTVEFVGTEKTKKYAARYVLDCVSERSL